LFRVKKSRKYPIKRDREGLSLRARCFELFEQGKRPVAVAEELKMKETTVCRYFRDWKRLGPNFELQYAYVKGLFKKTAPDREKSIELFARAYGIQKEQLEAILSQSHGLRRLVTGKFYFPAHADADHKRHMALELALLISDHLIKHGGKFEDVYFALKRYMRENMKYREEEDAAIKEENKSMKMTHAVLAADMENERRGRVKRDALSEEEHNPIIRFGIETEMKKAERTYWDRIGVLKTEGLTPEQAREKIYQDLLEKGDLKGAKMIREFQDKVHPLKTNDQITPPSTPQSPSPT
jgi:hypothetical protein